MSTSHALVCIGESVCEVDSACVGVRATAIPIASPVFTSQSNITTSTNWPTNVGWYALASSNNGAYVEWKAFSGGGWYSVNAYDAVTGLVSSGSVAQWVQMQFPRAYKLMTYTIVIQGGDSGHHPTSWDVQGSNDNMSFTTVQSDTQTTYTTKTFTVTAPHMPYRYWRFRFNSIYRRASIRNVGVGRIILNTEQYAYS